MSNNLITRVIRFLGIEIDEFLTEEQSAFR